MNQIEIYKTKDGQTQIDVKFEEDTVWLSQAQITALFERDRTVITRHIQNVFKEGELDEKSNVHFLHIPVLSSLGIIDNLKTNSSITVFPRWFVNFKDRARELFGNSDRFEMNRFHFGTYCHRNK